MKKVTCIFLTIVLLMCSAVPAVATTYYASNPVYVTTSDPNDTVTQYEILWGVAGTHNATITSATVKLQIQDRDQVSVNWCDSSGDTFDTTSVNTGSSTVNLTPPSGAYGASLVLTSSSETGSRWAWWYSVTNSQGNTTIFPDPNTGSGGGSTTIDLSPVVSALQIIQGQLTDIQDQLDSLTSNSSSSSSQLGDIITAINNQTSDIGDILDDMSTQLDTISGQLTSIMGKLDDIDSDILDIYNYISTPRTSQPFTLDLPEITIDPTPPDITEAPQQPYVYNKNLPEMPPFIDSPGPISLAPDPVAMVHDPPPEVDVPLAVDPVTKENPLQIDPVTKDSPLQMDPVSRENPLQMDTVTMETPRTVDNPIQIDQPRDRDNPISPDLPLVPDPPR